MSESKMVTEREAVIRERAAYLEALRSSRGADEYQCRGARWGVETMAEEAARLYPLPKVERPRVVAIDDRAWALREWRFVGGNLQSRRPGVDINGHEYAWTHVAQVTPTPAVVEALADLLANPTELVEDTP